MSTTAKQPSLPGAEQEQPLRIVRLEAESFKRLRVVSITPDGTVVRITGRNGQGKSSVLDAIACAIGGAKLSPERPVRKGAKSAKVELDLGEIVVRRKWTDAGGTYLEVVAKDGSKLATPQAVLDKLVGDLAFDPLAFSRLDDKARLAVLRNVTGLGKVFDELNAERDRRSESRRMTNHRIKTIEAKLSGLPSGPGSPAQTEEVSVAELADRHRKAVAIRDENQKKRTWLAQARQSIVGLKDRVREAEDELKAARLSLSNGEALVAKHAAAIDALVDPDLDSISRAMSEAEDTNRIVRASKERRDLEHELTGLRRESAAETRAIEQVEIRKGEAVAGAKLPIPGLTFGDDGVALGGVPFSQASTAEQLRASVAMGLAQNPRLRVMLVREGSLLDAESMKTLEAIAAEHGAQVWVECVTNGEAVGVVIEDGEVRDTEGNGQ